MDQSDKYRWQVNRANVNDKESAISLSTEMSDITVSSNPGVSIRMTLRPSRSKGGEEVTFAVQEMRLVPTGEKVDP